MKPGFSKSEFSPDSWQPIRFPLPKDSRSRGFPPLDTFSSRQLEDIKDWCDKNCRWHWLDMAESDGRRVFWFEDKQDALAFSLRWYPFKCS